MHLSVLSVDLDIECFLCVLAIGGMMFMLTASLAASIVALSCVYVLCKNTLK